MSSFIVDTDTIDRVVHFLKHPDNFSLKVEVEEETGFVAGKELAQAMFLLNCHAHHLRYGYSWSTHPISWESYIEELEGGKCPSNDFQVFKSLRCWLYQCSEGDVPETAFYKTMMHLSEKMAIQLVQNSPEYNQAVWG